MKRKELAASQAGNVSLGDEISVHRVGFGAMRLNTGNVLFARSLRFAV
jgi:hypothetical protein